VLIIGKRFFGAKTLKNLTAVEIQFDVTHSCTQLIFSIFLLSPAFLGEQKQEGKMPQKRE
jgi:hypothetical protein